MNQCNIGQRIKRKREDQKLSLQFVADKLDVNRSSVMRWENGETNRIKLPMLERLAQILQTTPGYLMGYEEEDKHSLYTSGQCVAPESACMLPVWKSLPCLEHHTEQNVACGYEIADAAYRNDCFFLRITEKSMAPSLEEGDLILVRRQNNLEKGDLGVFLLAEQDCLIRLYFPEEQLELHSFNPYYPTLRLDATEEKRVKIIGKVLESRRRW